MNQSPSKRVPAGSLVTTALGTALFALAACKSAEFNSETPRKNGATDTTIATDTQGTPPQEADTDATKNDTDTAAAGTKKKPATSTSTPVTNNTGLLGGLIDAFKNNIPSANPGTGGSSGTTPTTIPPAFKRCSADYFVPGTANPYMAGVANGKTITYDLSEGGGPNPTDTAPDQNPVLITPTANCINPGTVLAFTVAGSITFDKSVRPTDGNGRSDMIVSHQKGSTFGKSGITAPMCGLLGVFLGNGDPSAAAAPAALDFSSAAAREYSTLSPQVGQVFYIGTGKNRSGELRKVVVPQGATRFYMGILDSYQWNNNLGGLTGAIMIQN